MSDHGGASSGRGEVSSPRLDMVGYIPARAGGHAIDSTRRVPLGKTGLSVTRLGLGGAPLGGLFDPVDEAVAHAVVRHAWDVGLRLFDTAPLYGHGTSETRVGRVLRELPRDDFVPAANATSWAASSAGSAWPRRTWPRRSPRSAPDRPDRCWSASATRSTTSRTRAGWPGKLSGLVTEADRRHWSPDDLRPYAERALAWFGEDRLVFGSDWPVCLLAGAYGRVHDALDRALGPLPATARAKLFGENAARIYRLATADGPRPASV